MKRELTCLLLLGVAGALSLVIEEDTEFVEDYNVMSSHGGLEADVNSAVDNMLSIARGYFSQKGMVVVDLPSMSGDIKYESYVGHFTMSEGYLKNWATLHRIGNVDIDRRGNTLSLKVPLALSEMKGGYRNYTLNVVDDFLTGRMQFSYDDNSIIMKLNLRNPPNCRFSLEYVQLDRLDDVEVDLTGLGALTIIYNKISKTLIPYFEGRFRPIVNRKMEELLKDLLNEKSDEICRHFPSF